ncbi:MAG: hypothetical protein Q4A05_00550 [Ruminococcus sp.]|nr:hypothetical protein [Ruminococcus sp.]
MFKNVTKKIQILCKINVGVLTFLGACYGFILSPILIPTEDSGLLAALIGGCSGFFIGWASSLTLYAFSELCIDVAELNGRIISEDDDDSDDNNADDDE